MSEAKKLVRKTEMVERFVCPHCGGTIVVDKRMFNKGGDMSAKAEKVA